MARSQADRVDNYLQQELFDPTLLDMPTTSRKPISTTSSNSATTNTSNASNASSGTRSLSMPPSHLTRVDTPPITLDIPEAPPIRIVKSKRRKRHIAAYRQSGEIVISVPFRTTRAEISAVVPDLVARVMKGEEKSRRSERELEIRAENLLATYLPEFTQKPASISWRTMNERWGSCTTVDRTIRISDRLRTAPDYVIDSVLIHELIHLEVPGHGDQFQALLRRHPDLARAEAFLEGYESGAQGL